MQVQSLRSTQSDRRRDRGSYYTPSYVARAILDGCLTPLRRHVSPSDSPPLRILDPACGDGAFLGGAFDALIDWYHAIEEDVADSSKRSKHRPREKPHMDGEVGLRVIRDHLFGVDADFAAIEQLRHRLTERIDIARSQRSGLQDILHANFRHADALTGPDFSPEQSAGVADCENSNGEAEPLNWREAFPQVAVSGGFDVVVGNPPYRRELNAKQLFETIARSPLGRRWRQPRMDLWYYFLHRGFDLLRPGGRLSYIVNSYWTASASARTLIRRLQQEAAFEEIVQLGSAPIFSDVTGRHLIFRLRKQQRQTSCRVTDLSQTPDEIPHVLPTLMRAEPNDDAQRDSDRAIRLPRAECYHLSHHELFRDGQLILDRPHAWLKSLKTNSQLGDLYEVRQGMAENPPSVSARSAREFGGRYRAGEGVFVLTAAEVESLELSAVERGFLRPYFPTSSFGRYRLPVEPTHFVLYLTKQTAPSLDGYEQLHKHLQRFRPILERRRETRTGAIKWWQLHWPREERLFTEPRIISVQMGRIPQFARVNAPTFVGFSVNLVLDRSKEGMSLSALTGILNSTFASLWFSQHAKQRGTNIEINGGTLKRFPLPNRNFAVEQEIHQLVEQRHAIDATEMQTDLATEPSNTTAMLLERQVDQRFCQLYGVKVDDISLARG